MSQPDPVTVNCEFAATVYKAFQQRRFGIDACDNVEDLLKVSMRKQLFDWNQTDPEAGLYCDLIQQP